MTESKQLTLRDAVHELESQFDGISGQFAIAVPPHVKPEKLKSVVLTAANLNPDLLRADRRSLFNSCLKAAADGLMPDGREGFLNVYNQKVKDGDKEKWIKSVQWQPMVFGIIKRIRQSGEITSVGARIVYERELDIDPTTGKPRFLFIIDDSGERIEHNPIIFGERGKMIGVYAYAAFKDGTREFEPMSLADIEKVRSKSKSPNKGPWADWYEEMAKKTAIRRLSKRLPLSSEIMATVMREDPRAEIDDIRDRQVHEAVAQLGAPSPLDDDVIEHQTIEEPEQHQTLAYWEQFCANTIAEMQAQSMTKPDLHAFGDHIKSMLGGAEIGEDDRKRLQGEFNAAYLSELKKL